MFDEWHHGWTCGKTQILVDEWGIWACTHTRSIIQWCYRHLYAQWDCICICSLEATWNRWMDWCLENIEVYLRGKSYIAEEWWSDLHAIHRFVTSTSGTVSITQHQHLFTFFCLFSSTPDLALQSGLGLDSHHCLQDLASPCACWGALHREQASCD